MNNEDGLASHEQDGTRYKQSKTVMVQVRASIKRHLCDYLTKSNQSIYGPNGNFWMSGPRMNVLPDTLISQPWFFSWKSSEINDDCIGIIIC